MGKYSDLALQPVTSDVKDKKMSYSDMALETKQPDQEAAPTTMPVSGSEFAEMPADWNLDKYSQDSSLDRAFAKRNWQGEQTSDSLNKGEIGLGSAALQTVGQGVGKVLDFAGNEVSDTAQAVAKGAEAAYGLVPEPLKEASASGREATIEPVIEALGTTAEKLYNTDAVKAIRELGSESVQDVGDWWKALDKNTRKNLESAGLIASVVPVKKTADTIHGTVVALKTSLRKEAVDKAFTQISPYLDKKRLIEVFKRKELKGSKGVYKPTDYEIAASETVADLKHFNPAKGGDYNGIIVNNAKESAEKTISAKYKAAEVPINRSVKNEIILNVQRLAKENPMFEGPNTKPLKDRIKTAMKILKRNEVNGKHTSYTLNKARREFDLLNEQENAAADWAQGRGTAMHQLNKNIRDTMNDLVDAHTPESLKAERTKLSHLKYASDNMAEKFSKETESVINSGIHTLSKIARVSWATKYLPGAGAVTAGVITAANASPKLMATAAILAGITYVGGKAVMSRTSRKMLLGLVSELDKAGKVAKTAAETVGIKKTRTAISTLIANSAIEQYDEDKEQK